MIRRGGPRFSTSPAPRGAPSFAHFAKGGRVGNVHALGLITRRNPETKSRSSPHSLVHTSSQRGYRLKYINAASPSKAIVAIQRTEPLNSVFLTIGGILIQMLCLF